MGVAYAVDRPAKLNTPNTAAFKGVFIIVFFFPPANRRNCAKLSLTLGIREVNDYVSGHLSQLVPETGMVGGGVELSIQKT